MNKNIEPKTFESELPQLGVSIDRFKFRVWDRDKNKFSSFIKHELRFGCEGILTMPLTKAGVYVIQQCTGLKDSKNKLIFEGDILVYYLSYGESEGGQKDNIVSSVDWADGSFVFDGDILSQSDANFFEIIGNIFEHANLLK